MSQAQDRALSLAGCGITFGGSASQQLWGRLNGAVVVGLTATYDTRACHVPDTFHCL